MLSQGPTGPAEGGRSGSSHGPRTGYDRDQFGPTWKDIDHIGCDQRNDVLARDLIDTTFRPGTNNCIVFTGTLHDPYAGTTIAFQRSQTTSDDMQIDHVVALSKRLVDRRPTARPDDPRAARERPTQPAATDGPTNQTKGDADAATCLAPNRATWCPHVARQVAVKAKYGL